VGGVEVTFTSVWPDVDFLSEDFDEDALLALPIEQHSMMFAQSTVTIADGAATLVDTVEFQPVLLGDIADIVDRPEVDCS